MKFLKYGSPLTIAALLISFLTINGCKSDDNGGDPTPVNPNQEINEWIYTNMDTYYLWTDQIPANPNYSRAPEDFFDGLLSSQDRFSVIYPDFQELINSLNGVTLESGYEFTLFRESSQNENVIAVVLYIKNGSPAESAGLLRGDIITQINGTTMTLNNYQGLLAETSETHEVAYERFNYGTSTYEDMGTVSLDAVQLSEDPNYIANVIELDGQKIGYFMYNFFSPGVTGTEYDQEMDNVFSEFQSAGISHLILDLRYNSGGSVSSARNLGSQIAPGVTATDVFYENIWNDELQTYIESLSNGDDILRGKFAEKAENVGSLLAGQTVYILVGSRTASASELMINGLLPYMNVVIIGEETIGKNVGSIPIEDEDNEENEYGMLPIVFRTYNSAGQSDYASGFVPTGDNYVEEFMQLPLEPLGDISDPLVERALTLIGVNVPGGIGGRMAPASQQVVGEALGSSLDKKTRTNTMYLEKGF